MKRVRMLSTLSIGVILILGSAGWLTQPVRAQEPEPAKKTLAEWEAFFAKYKKNLAPLAYNAKKNLAYTKPAPNINPQQTAWARQMGQGIYMPVKDKVYVAVGYQLASPTMVVGDDGVIIIDPGENDKAAAACLKDFRRFTNKPVKAVIYTHRHPDHAFGIKGLGVTPEDVKSGKVQVFAHDTFLQYLINDSSVVGPILSVRTAYAGPLVGAGPMGYIQIGLGPTFSTGPVSMILPTKTFTDELDVTVAGVKMKLFHAYGDAEDEIDVWFPELKHVHGSETIQGETFPNLYSLRGTKFRDPVKWYKGIDNLLQYAKMADTYSGSHMRPWVGNGFIVERITNYRDAIQYVHDQTIRYTNKGYTPEELVEVVKLPKHLAEDPWLQEYYGTVAHSVRNIYTGYLGWYQADPTVLATPGFVEKSKLYLQAMGGRENVLRIAQKAIDKKNYGWAMEVLTHPIRVNHEDMAARKLKAEAMRKWGYQQKNIYWRNIALTGAQELEGKIDTSNLWNFAAPDIVKALPASSIIESLRVRLDAEKTRDKHLTIGFHFTDINEGYGLEIRKGVCVFHSTLPKKTGGMLVTTKDVLNKVLLKETTLAKAITDGEVRIQGNAEMVQEFFNYFEPAAKSIPALIVR